MPNPAPSDFPLNELIRERWSPLAFSNRMIPKRILGSLFEAARWAPSSYNEQPWVFLVATQEQPAEFAKLASCLVEANRVWAERAYCLALSCARTEFSRNNKPNRHASHDVGLATQNLILQALAQGLYCHPMAGFDTEKTRALFQIPTEFEPLTALAIGSPAPDLSELDEGLRQRQLGPRTRKPLTEMVFTGHWGKFAGPFE